MRYIYGMFKTRQHAEDFLYDMWACGDVGPLEKPRIERRGIGFAITLFCD